MCQPQRGRQRAAQMSHLVRVAGRLRLGCQHEQRLVCSLQVRGLSGGCRGRRGGAGACNFQAVLLRPGQPRAAVAQLTQGRRLTQVVEDGLQQGGVAHIPAQGSRAGVKEERPLGTPTTNQCTAPPTRASQATTTRTSLSPPALVSTARLPSLLWAGGRGRWAGARAQETVCPEAHAAGQLPRQRPEQRHRGRLLNALQRLGLGVASARCWWWAPYRPGFAEGVIFCPRAATLAVCPPFRDVAPWCLSPRRMARQAACRVEVTGSRPGACTMASGRDTPPLLPRSSSRRSRRSRQRQRGALMRVHETTWRLCAPLAEQCSTTLR
jgi:hypothetical protein